MYALRSAPSSIIPLNDTKMFVRWKMTRTMRMGENTIATKFGSWNAEAQGLGIAKKTEPYANSVEGRETTALFELWSLQKPPEFTLIDTSGNQSESRALKAE